MKDNSPHILLVNPWIHDFAAYDFWAKPYGLLQIAGILRAHGARVSYIDCLDRFHPRAPEKDPTARYGRGPYRKTKIRPPALLADIARTYSRYGIDPDWFREDLAACRPPDLVLVTSLMTYWYPGVQETIAGIRDIFANVPIVLGGVYATLCQGHAENHSGADLVASGTREKDILPIVAKFTGWQPSPTFEPTDLNTYPYPAFDLQHTIGYIPLLTTRGCPFDCAYCASRTLSPGFLKRAPEQVAAEIDYWHRSHGVHDMALYDDAFLINADTHAIPILEKIISRGYPIRFHTPNALHIRGISRQTARLMYNAGFKTIRLGLETYQDADRDGLDNKTNAEEFKRAVKNLLDAGFSASQVGAYLLVGLPGQGRKEVEHSIRMVKDCGILPVPAHYTPIPHTRLWPKAVAASRYDLAADPIYTNNAVSPCQTEPFDWADLSRIKRLTQISP